MRPRPSDRLPVVSIKMTASDKVTRTIPPNWAEAPMSAYFPGSAQAFGPSYVFSFDNNECNGSTNLRTSR